MQTLVEDSKGRIWIGTSKGLNQYNHTTGTFNHFINQPLNPNSLGHDLVLSLLEDSEGILWVGTFEGGIKPL